MATPEVLLSVRDVRSGYRNHPILLGVNFDVSVGELVVLLGANGSGKSTCLNTISGFVSLSAGSIALGGAEIGHLAPHLVFRTGVVQVSQKRDLFPDLTVEDNLRLGGRTRGREFIAESLERVYTYFPRLQERTHQRTRVLSGGEQQMVAIGRALVSRPRLLLLDEPSGGLSPQFVNEIAGIFGRLKIDGVTILMVEQDINLALAVADRFIILRSGTIREDRTIKGSTETKEEIVRKIYL
ncbi:MAG: ABC transporter ATP-binding protein [Candidimonas sp.]|nr:MAG: ABC transporter ATP-binding protein [Candidimonas sp.]